MGAFDIIAKAAKGAKKAPFYSKIDEVLESMPRNKGTGAEFLREIEKTKGVKPAEIQDRGIVKALKDKPKMTKAEVQKILEENPPPRVQEKVLGGNSPDYDEFLEAKAQDVYGVDWFDLNRQEKAEIERMFNELPATKYDEYKTPGGENYREILLKLPERGLTKQEKSELMLYEADMRRSNGQATPERLARYQELKAKESAGSTNYTSGHYKEDPNLLAHIRVQDFKTPEGKKVLLVDEIQSDWHQEGRKKGYKDSEKVAQHQALESRIQQLRDDFANDGAPEDQIRAEMISLRRQQEALGNVDDNSAVPDAPFKKNWHELAMKRVMDYAAENGYDTVAITPGAEQAKRYDLSKQIDSIAYNPETKLLDAWDHNRRQVMRREITDESQLEDYIGKEAAKKLLQTEPMMGKHLLEGQDLQVGGEGMKGFYDKILPDYLNNFGKPYGASVREAPLNYVPSAQRVAQGEEADALLGQLGVDIPTVAPTQYHMFDITPQLREEVKTKGLPLYSKTGMGPEGLAAGTGAATIGSEVFDTNNEQQVQNPVHFTENPDAMLLELMQRN